MATIIDPASTTLTASRFILSTYYDKVFLERLKANTEWYTLCEKKRFPEHQGKVVKFSSWKPLAIGTALTEGTNPTAKVLSAFNVTATLRQWGDYIAVTDLMEMTGITSTIQEAVGIIGDQSALTIDTVIRNAAWGGGLPSATSNLSASLRMRYTGSVSTLSALNGKVAGFTIRLTRQCSGLLAATGRLSTVILHAASAYNAASKMTLKDIRESVGVLRGRNVKPFTSDGYYMGIVDPRGLVDVMNDTSTGGWIDWQKYSNPAVMEKGEVGKAEGVRIIASTNSLDRALNRGCLVSANILTIVGKGALGAIDYNNTYDGKGKNYIIMASASENDISNPLKLIAGTVGWKCTMAAVVLNTSCGLHLFGVRN